VTGLVTARGPALAAIWALRTPGGDVGPIAERLQDALAALARALLDDLYPGALAKGSDT